LVKTNNGDISFSKRSVEQFLGGGGTTAFADSIADLEEELHDYPSLVYDGPFSQHVTNKEPVFLMNKASIDENMAKSIACSYIGNEAVLAGKGDGKIPSYYFTNGDKKIEITQAGGNILWMLNNRRIGEKKLTLNQAKQYAAKFLRQNGFSNMTESYYDIKDDCAVINYAWTQNGYTVFPDLVKVKVALDNGEIVGFEGRGYIMNHTPRNIPEPRITPEEAVKMVSRGAEVESTSYAVIPLDGGSEAFCYQLKGTIDDKHFLIYINTQTGAEEKIMILLETETGVLAV
ncbi:MAG: PepSY1/2 domain-containing protein, partial [Clostridia bacterium]